MKKVIILQHRLLHYRLKLFQLLHDNCASKNIELCLVHGQATLQEAKKRDIGDLPWADRVVNSYISIGGKDLLWQPFPARHRDADLVIVMQENRLLSNYPWLFFHGLHKTRIAYWGHGRNFQSTNASGLREQWKKLLIGRVDWWFAYTQMTKDILLTDGYPAERITVLDNAIDNESFSADLNDISAAELQQLRAELGLSTASQVGLFCGSLYPDKRLDFMIAAVDKIRAALPDFHLIIIGDGPSAPAIKEAAAARPWLHIVGVQKGREKAAYFRLAQIVLNPGAVGLHVLDSFCAGIPLVTTEDARHGPEIAYLVNGRNGMISAGTEQAYADAVLALFTDPALYEQVRKAALADAQHYTLSNMVNNFVTGMESCLASAKKC